MSPGAHLLASWILAERCGLARRERRLVALAGVIPDVDGLGLIVDLAAGLRHRFTDYYGTYHHVLGHNLSAALLISAAVGALARSRRWRTAGLVLMTFHLHLVCDLAGSRGPDGYAWPIHYLYPFSSRGIWVWSGQWELNAWPNLLLLATFFFGAVALAARRGYSFLEVISPGLDRAVFEALARRGWGPPAGP